MRRSQVLEVGLLVCGLCAAALAAAPGVRAALAERHAALIASLPETQLEAKLLPKATGANDGAIVPDDALSGTYLAGAVNDSGPPHAIGILRIPALHLVAPIISGIDHSDLLHGIGHVPGTGYAGGLGNMAVAGHRDTFFRPLRSIAKGMDVFVSGPAGYYLYRVDHTEIIKPEQLGVLDIGNRPELTMITCYPFNFLGAAPERFVVHAHLVSVAPEPAA